MRFQLKERKRNALNVTYHVLDEQDSICGSICVKLKEAESLLRHWQEPVGDSPQSKPSFSPKQSLAAAFMKHRKPFLQGAILRGCNG